MQAAASAAASSVASLPASLASSSAGLQAGANIQVATSSAVSSAPAGTLVPAVVASQAANTSVSSAASSSETLVKKIPLDEISFSFGAECWLEVSDSRGDVLATELQPAGSKIKLIGQAPFDVKLGNAPAVEIQLNGKKIDVIPLLGTNVLIMKVGN
jgi:cytoskeleton protein RodZ